MSQLTLLTLAKQNHPSAIATLMNQSLQAQGITASVSLIDDRLRIILAAERSLDPAIMMEFVRRGMEKLQPEAVKTIEVYGKLIHQDLVTWRRIFTLGSQTPSTSRAAAVAADKTLANPPEQQPATLTISPPLHQSQPQPYPLIALSQRSTAPSPLMKRFPFNHLFFGQLAFMGATIAFSLSILAGAYWTLTHPQGGEGVPTSVNSSFQIAPNSTALHRDLTVSNIDWKTEAQARYVSGIVKNTSNQAYPYVQVEFDLYTPAGTRVGSALAGVENLEPTQVKQFRAIVFGDQATKAELKAVQGLRPVQTMASP